MGTVINPTVGRIVHFYEGGKSQREAGEQPFAAMIASVNSNSKTVNIGYLLHNGMANHATSIPLIQEGEEYPAESFCTWMPYQTAVASGKQAPTLHAEPGALELGAAVRKAGLAGS